MFRKALALALAALVGASTFSPNAFARPLSPDGGPPTLARVKVELMAPTKATVTWVQVSGLPSSWDYKSAINWVDGYTKTDMQLGTCKAQQNCIKIIKGKVSGNRYGYTTNVNKSSMPLFGGTKKTWRESVIKIDVDRAAKNGHYNAATKRWLIEHELAAHAHHAGHSTACRTTFEFNRCRNGSIPARVFSAGEKAILARY